MSITQAQYTAVQRGLTAVFKEGARTAPVFYPRVCTVRPSSGEDEGYAMFGSMPGMREWLGERDFNELTAADFTLKNKLWESGVELEKTRVDDARVGIFSDVMGELGMEAAQHPDELLAELQANGDAQVCWDGQNFYDTDHVWRDSGTQSNIVNVSVADTANITAAEIKSGFNQAVTRMLGFKRDNGKLWIRPTVERLNDLQLQVPLPLREKAHVAFEQTISLEGTAGTSNVVVDRPSIVCTPLLGSAGFGADTEMYVNFLGGRLKPFIFQLRERLRTSTKGATDDETKFLKFMATARYNVGFLMWMYSIKVVFA